MERLKRTEQRQEWLQEPKPPTPPKRVVLKPLTSQESEAMHRMVLETRIRQGMRRIVRQENLDGLGFDRIEALIVQELYSPDNDELRFHRRRISTTQQKILTELGRQGGQARAAKLSPARKREIAMMGAKARLRNLHAREAKRAEKKAGKK